MNMTTLSRIAALLLSALLAITTQTSFAEKPNAEAARERLKKAEALFAERCKSAGVKIHRTAENVEGIFLMKLRPEKDNFSDQFAMDDPYGRDLGGDAYIKSFLRGHYESETSGTPISGAPPSPKAYHYVEVLDPKDGQRYRYTGSMKVVGRMVSSAPNVQVELKRNPNFDLNIYAFKLDRLPSPAKRPPRYGVTYDDISTREDREYWIAGSSLKVIDLKTNEVMAERIGYMMDRGQGNTSGGRSPWLLAADNACPAFAPRHGATAQPYQALDLVEKTLKPKLGN